MKARLSFMLLFAGSLVSFLPAQTQNLVIDRGIIGLSQALDRLPYTSRVLFIAAHPDDENSGVLPYVSRGLHARTALLTLTRGEGGQNLIGPDLFDALGLIRTGELVAAGEYYGVQQFFTRAFDFGFSKSSQETLEKWGKETVLSDMVRAIRQFRPQVIISVWRGTAIDGHGHHQASGLLAREAFLAAGDPTRFPELIQEGLTAWKVQKFYIPGTDDQKKEKAPEDSVITVDPGKHVPLLGASFQEIASFGYSFHRSQGTGNSYSAPGSKTFSYRLVFPEHDAESGLFDGLNIHLSDLSTQLSTDDPQRVELEKGLRFLEGVIAKARERLQPTDFSGTVTPLREGLGKVREMRQSLAADPRAQTRYQELIFLLKEKEDDFRKALELAAGVYFEALASDPDVTPSQTFEVSVMVVNRSGETMDVQHIELLGEPGWAFTLHEGAAKSLPAEGKLSLKYAVSVPADVPLSQPHWKRNSRRETTYTVADKHLITAPLISPKLFARMDYLLGGTALSLKQPVEYLDSDRFKGARKIPLMVVPTVGIEVTPPQQLVSISIPGHEREVRVKLINNSVAPVVGKLSLTAPAGWNAEPHQVDFKMAKEGEASTFKFKAQAGKGISPGRAGFEAVVDIGSKRIDQSYRIYSVLDLWRFPLYKTASSEVVAFDYKLPGRLNVGYIMGAGDRVPEVLSQLGIPVRLLDAVELATSDLLEYDCIIAGIRAYDVRPDLIAYNARLLDYVNRGGLFVVQYHRPDTWNKTQYAPYPAKIQSDDHRVTDETAPVRILDAADPVFLYPNKITEKDFDDWVQERGLYFIQERDPRYKPLLSSNDPGQPPLDGGLLVADYGKGKYVLTSYAWFRQLPEGVPGAIRIFINLISLREKSSERAKAKG